jgi:hypothetical protein
MVVPFKRMGPVLVGVGVMAAAVALVPMVLVLVGAAGLGH